MAIDYSFKGGKGHRKAIMTVDIHEDSYDAICKMIGSGKNFMFETCAPFLEDAYNMFGGNCYGTIISMAINCLLFRTIRVFNEKGFLAKREEDVFYDMSETILPIMCCLNDKNGIPINELRFFYTEVEEVISEITPCLIENVGKVFSDNLRKAVKHDTRPAGEIALEILVSISSEVISVDKYAN